MTEAGYRRIQARIRNELGNISPSWWIAASFTFVGIAASSLVTKLAIPSKVVGLHSGTKTILSFIIGVGVLLAAVCYIGYRQQISSAKRTAESICNEMDTYSRSQSLIEHH